MPPLRPLPLGGNAKSMASLIPVVGEVQMVEAPKAIAGVARLLAVPKQSVVQVIYDATGGAWWFWRRGRNPKKVNRRAAQWISDRGNQKPFIEGPVLYTSHNEKVSMTKQG